MFDDPRDLNRDFGRDPYNQRYANLSGEGSGYALPLALLAIILIIGGLIVFTPHDNMQTAANNPSNPAAERTLPSPNAAKPAPPVTAPTSPQQ